MSVRRWRCGGCSHGEKELALAEGDQEGIPLEMMEEVMALAKQLERWPGNRGVEGLEKGDMVSHATCYCERGQVS